MPDERRTERFSTAWGVLGCLLAVSLSYHITSRTALFFEPGYFLPLLTAWLAARMGARVAIYVLVFGMLAAFDVGVSIGAIRLRVTIPTEVYFVSVLAACAFAEPNGCGRVSEWIRPWWRWALWTALCALALAGFLRLSWHFEMVGAFTSRWEVGVIVTMLVALATVSWAGLATRLRPVRASLSSRPILAATLILLLCILLSALFFNIRFPSFGDLTLRLGLASSWSWLTVACFAATAFKLLDWRAVIAVLLALFGAEWAFVEYWFPLATQSFRSPGLEPGIIVAGWLHNDVPGLWLLADAVCAALFGHAIAPYWRGRDVTALHGRRTLSLLVAILAIQFVALPLLTRGQSVPTAPLLLGGVAFMTGVVWGRKALLPAPLIIVLLYLVGLVAYDARGMWWMASEMGRFGMPAFPFVFFGVLVGESARTPSTLGSKLRIVDVTALAKLVRELDVSATIKAFVAVLAPLAVLGNLGKVIAFFDGFLEMGFDLHDGEETLFFVAFLIIAVSAVFAPLGFILTDWLARRETGRHFSAISGAALGMLGLIIVSQAFGLSTFLLEETDMAPFSVGRWIVAGGVLLVLTLFAGRMLAPSDRVRFVFLGALFLIGIVALGAGIYPVIDELRDPETLQELLSFALTVAVAAFIFWFIGRGVRLRLLLSGTRPRSLLLGELRGGFWVRMGFLIGLPSSHWNLASLRQPSFWLFVLSRPLVYIGAVFLFANASVLGPVMTLALGVVLIVAGHLAFLAAKRLTSRDVWRPESRTETRSPILFLRSFDDDQLDFKRPWWDVRGRWFDLWSFRGNADEVLVDEVAQYGPVVALGQPGEKRAPFGALRHYATEEDWQTTVTDAARRSQAIVIAAGGTPGVLWEYELLRREGLIDRTLLLLRPAPHDDDANRRALEAIAQSQGVEEHAGDDRHLVALLQTDSGPVLLTARRYVAGAYVAAIRAHFQKCGAEALGDPAALFAVR